MKKIDCFIPYIVHSQACFMAEQLQGIPCVNKIYFLSSSSVTEKIAGCEFLFTEEGLGSTQTIKKIISFTQEEFTLICTKYTPLEFGLFALERMLTVARDTNAGMLYSDYYQKSGDTYTPSPVIDYQQGSLRDDFNFGPVLLFDTARIKQAVKNMETDYRFAAIYELRLRIAEIAELVHINEYLYSQWEEDTRKSGEKIFDYVDPKNRTVQIEMEKVCTAYLKRIGGYLAPYFEPVAFDAPEFEYEASIIIPVRNRIRTIEDAIRSALAQRTIFKFNVIVIDNYSTDGTSEAIHSFCTDRRVIHLIPERRDLGIGGCWNLGVHHPSCGKFAVQLDSDDVYSSPDTLQKIVAAFYGQQAAMIVGTYRMTDFKMNEIPPGIIDHKEWTVENGRNNALRINGLGAPRAFYTPILRKLNFPNTNYGEDYAVGLRISRTWAIGRIYDVLYLCRRWEDNSDAALDIQKMNAHNTYKDRIRTWELQARIALNSSSSH